MQKMKKSIILLLCLVLLLTVPAFCTLAYLTDVDVSISRFDVPVSETSEEGTEPFADESEECSEPEESTPESSEPEESTPESSEPEESTPESSEPEEPTTEGEEPTTETTDPET